jgi:hypothetical protein
VLLHTDKKIYIEFSDFLNAGWKEDTIKKSNLRNGANWQMVKNPIDQRKPMVQYESLVDAHKEKIHMWLRKSNNCKHDQHTKCECGNPYEYMTKEPIRKMVQKDFKAEAFYMQYRYVASNNKSTALPGETVAQYTTEASWLNMLLLTKDNMKDMVKKALNLTVDTFYKKVGELIEAEIAQGNMNGKFPTSYQRLIAKVEEYRSGGYPS